MDGRCGDNPEFFWVLFGSHPQNTSKPLQPSPTSELTCLCLFLVDPLPPPPQKEKRGDNLVVVLLASLEHHTTGTLSKRHTHMSQNWSLRPFCQAWSEAVELLAVSRSAQTQPNVILYGGANRCLEVNLQPETRKTPEKHLQTSTPHTTYKETMPKKIPLTGGLLVLLVASGRFCHQRLGRPEHRLGSGAGMPAADEAGAVETGLGFGIAGGGGRFGDTFSFHVLQIRLGFPNMFRFVHLAR